MNDPYAYYNAHMHSAFMRNANRELSELEESFLAAAEAQAQANAAQRAEKLAAIKQMVGAALKRVSFARTSRHQQAQFGA